MHRIFAAGALGLLSIVAGPGAEAGVAMNWYEVRPRGSLFDHIYAVDKDLGPGEFVQQGDGIIDPGRVGSRDFITLYDVGVPGSFQVETAPHTWSVDIVNVGPAAGGTVPFDDPLLANVVLMANTGGQANVVITSPYGGTRVTQFTSQRTDGSGLDAGKIGEIGPAVAPALPEPGSVAVLGMAGLLLARRRRRG